MADQQLSTDPPPHQAPPWKIALPFVVFIVIVLGTYAWHRQSLALVAVALATIMGAVWTYGAWRVRRDETRVAACPPFKAPEGTEAVVIARARRDGCCSPVGYLLATATALWWTPAREAWHAGDPVAGDITQTAELVAHRADIARYQMVTGIFSGDAVTLTLTHGVRQFRLLDPEGMVHLLTLLEDEGGSRM